MLLSSIPFYESIRNLGYFDKNQCPLVEMQTMSGNHYFLQYHRGADINLSQFNLERETEKGEIKATLVRGVTPKEGMSVCVNLHKWRGNNFLTQEEGAIDDSELDIFTELMVRQRKLQIAKTKSMEQFANHLISGHLSKSIVFKPLVSVVLQSEEASSLFKMPDSVTSSALQAQVRVISDGRNAYIKKLG